MLRILLNATITVKMMALLVLVVALFMGVLLLEYLPTFERELVKDRKEGLKHVVEVAYALLEEYQHRVEGGELSLKEAQARAVRRIGNLRYGNNDYYWINDDTLPIPTMIVHPIISGLDGKVLDDPRFHYASAMQFGVDGRIERIPGGNKNLFQAFAELAHECNEGYVTYAWPKPTKNGPTEELYAKESFVKYFKPWGWVVGSGVYVDDIEARLAQLRWSIFVSTGVILFIALLVLSSFAVTFITRPMNALVRYAEKVSAGNLNAEVPGRFYAETARLKHMITKMVGDLEHAIMHAEAKQREALEEAEKNRLLTEKLDALFKSMTEIVATHELVFDDAGTPIDYRITDCNDAFLNAGGFEKEAVAGKLATEVYPDEAPPYLDVYARVAMSGIPYAFETYHAPWGKHFIISVASPGKNEFVTISTDITEHRRAEETIREREARLRTLSDNLPNGMVYQIDSGTDGEQRKFTYISAGVEHIHGISAAEAMADASRIYDQMIEEDRSRVAADEAHALAAIAPFRAEVRNRLPSGELRWTLIASAPRRLPNSHVVWDGVEIDITERKQAEEALQESNERLQTVMNSIDAFIYIADMQTHEILFLNEYAMKTWGNVVGEKCWEALQHLDGPCPFCTNDKLLTPDGKPAGIYQWEFQNQVNGHWYDIRDCAIQWTDGRMVRFEIATDITGRKRAEQALEESEERLNLAMGVANDGVWDWSIVQNQVYFDDRYYTMSGYAPNEFPHQFEEWEKRVHPDDIAQAKNAIQTYFEGSSPIFDVEFRFLRKEGTWMWIRGRGKIVERDADGSVLRMVGTHTDITERKRAEEEKEKLQEQLIQAQKMESIGRLAGGVAHDFNNMLGVILGHTEMALAQSNPSEKLYHDLQEIRIAAERSADLTRQLLAFARKQTVAPKVLDLNDTIGGMLKMLRRMIGEDIDLVWKPGKEIWPVRMDPSQLDQILANLCVNARDAINGLGNVTIETQNAAVDGGLFPDDAELRPGEYVMLAVSDDGCGMDKETLGKLFDPFFTTKEVGKGTGLGLATVYGAIRQNGGYVNVYSEPGQGTTFKIYLPRHLAKAERTKEAPPATPPHQGGGTVLLVEDEPAILKMAKRMLEHLGYTVLSADTPGAAIRIAQEHKGVIDLLMTDVIMPEMNGRDLAKNLLSLYPNLKRLFMSGYTADVIAHHGVLDPGVNFIQKPFSMNALAEKMREILEER